MVLVRHSDKAIPFMPGSVPQPLLFSVELQAPLWLDRGPLDVEAPERHKHGPATAPGHTAVGYASKFDGQFTVGATTAKSTSGWVLQLFTM